MIKIGIDPDISESGFCILFNNEVKELSLLPFFDLTAHLLELKECYEGCKQKYVVVIEKGEDNSSLFNAVNAGIATYNSPTNKRKSLIQKLKSALNAAAQAGMRTGKNFEVTELLITQL